MIFNFRTENTPSSARTDLSSCQTGSDMGWDFRSFNPLLASNVLRVRSRLYFSEGLGV